MFAKKKRRDPAQSQDLTVPAGTEQETGFTRAETEKVTGPVPIERRSREFKRVKKKK
jgi:hypothetical protein